MNKMTTVLLLVLGSVFGLAFPTYIIAHESTNQEETKLRVGTFDSRALAIAYYRSQQFSSQVKEMQAELEQAQKDGDTKRVAELEALGPEMQARVHGQGFGTAPVANILAKIESELPGIAKEAGVDIIVSKWNITYQRENLEFVDVSGLMVQPFSPDEATLKVISEIMKQKPQPTETATGKLK